MPPTPLAGNAVTGIPDQAGAPGTRVPAPATPGHRPRTARPLLRRVPETGAHYYDPLFEQPDLVEDDYHRFRNQPRGW